MLLRLFASPNHDHAGADDYDNDHDNNYDNNYNYNTSSMFQPSPM